MTITTFFRPRAVALLLAAVTCALLASCFPYAASYVHLDGEGATPVLGFCRISGPPVAVRYQRQGASLEVSIEPGALRRSQAAYLAVRVARGRAVSVNGEAAVLSVNGTLVKRLASMRAREQDVVQKPGARALLPPPGNEQFEEFRFELVDMPVVGAPGTLALPPITIDGVEINLPPMHFERRHYAGVAPINC